MRAMLGMPILPPSPCLNITFVSLMGKICIGVASTPEAMSNPRRYIELLLESLDQLEQALAPPADAGRRRVGKKTRTGKAAAAKAVRKKPAARKAGRSKSAVGKSAAGSSSRKTSPANKRRT